jgi:hypothetical protein
MTSSEGSTPPLPDRLPEEAVKAVAEAYYSRAAAGADAARERAQTAFTMTSAIAAALAAAGIFGDITEKTRSVQILGFAAFISWLVTSLLLLYAAVGEFWHPEEAEEDAPPPHYSEYQVMKIAHDDTHFVAVVYQDVRDERDAVYNRLRAALNAALVALALTGATGGVALFEGKPSHPVDSLVQLNTAGRIDLANLCPTSSGHDQVRAAVDPSELDQPFVQLKLPAGACDGHAVSIELPRADIRGVEKIPAD